MSAELLRRAAAALRQHLQDLTEAQRGEAPWYEARTVVGKWGTFAAVAPEDARFIELMSPPVAVALADLLEHADAISDTLDNDHLAELEHLARAILREEP